MCRHRPTYKAVKAHLVYNSNTIWVSDELLSHTFDRFSASVKHTPRRHGSFVPGPLECRRRLGKRRMAQLSEQSNITSFEPSVLWGSSGDIAGEQWHWHAPMKHEAMVLKNSKLVPSWLSQWKVESGKASYSSAEEMVLLPMQIDVSATASDHVESFRARLQRAQQQDVSQICDKFNKTFRQDLLLGLVADRTVYASLQSVTKDLRQAINCKNRADLYCLAFYRAVWGGILHCKVLQPTEFNGSTLGRLLCLLAKLPMGLDAQNLACSVLHSISPGQAQSMLDGIHCIVIACARTWHTDCGLGSCDSQLANAKELVQTAQAKLFEVQAMVSAFSKSFLSEDNKRKVRRAVFDVHLAIKQGMESAHIVDQAMWSSRASVNSLAAALENVPEVVLRGILEACSTQLAIECKKLRAKSWKIRYAWMSLVVRIRYMNYQDLLKSWRTIELCDAPLMEKESSEVILSHWIKQGLVKQPHLVRNTFEASGVPNPSFASLLFAIEKHEGGCSAKTHDVLCFLREIGRYMVAYKLLPRMLRMGIKLRRDSFEHVIDLMSYHDTSLALKIWKYYIVKHHQHKPPLRLDRCSNFALAMINDAKISPKVIWKALGIPLYEELPPRCRVPKKFLTPSMITTISDMAMAFARSDARPIRVSLRNVAQCLHHLRVHGANLSPELTRAITHAGITRAVTAGQGVGEERLRWVLDLVGSAEGSETAEAVEKTVHHWKHYLGWKQTQDKREDNVLRVGPID